MLAGKKTSWDTSVSTEKNYIPLNRLTDKVSDAMDSALAALSESLKDKVPGDVLAYVKQRACFALHRIELCFADDISVLESAALSPQAAERTLFLDQKTYKEIRRELGKAIKEQLPEADNDDYHINLIVGLIEDSIASNFMAALFGKAEQVEAERKQVEQMSQEVMQRVERERKRFAYDLHDGPAQLISSALLQVDLLSDLVASAEAKRELASLQDILKQGLDELRNAIYELKPHPVNQKSFVGCIRDYAAQFSNSTGCEAVVTVKSRHRKLPEASELNAHKVVQEALHNVQKHASATHVDIRIEFSTEAVTITIEDNGIGFEVPESIRKSSGLSGFGLASMRDRMEQCGGTFVITSKPGLGTKIHCSIPLAGKSNQDTKNWEA